MREFVFYRGPEKVWKSEVHNPRLLCIRVTPGSTRWWIGFHNLTIEHLMRQPGWGIFTPRVLRGKVLRPPHPLRAMRALLGWRGWVVPSRGGRGVGQYLMTTQRLNPLGYRSVYKEPHKI